MAKLYVLLLILFIMCSCMQNDNKIEKKEYLKLEEQINENQNKEINKKRNNEEEKITNNKPKKIEDKEFTRFLKEPEAKPQNVIIKVYKSKRILEMYGDNSLIAMFKVGLGNNPLGDKEKEGDMKTPEGKYYICTRNPKSRFTLFLGISYPNIEDAENGLNKGLISQREFNRIKNAINNKQTPPWNTPLGGEVGIHGGGNGSDWTWGCVALSDDDIRIMWKYVELKTPVEIYE